jgi:hypothetical protein
VKFPTFLMLLGGAALLLCAAMVVHTSTAKPSTPAAVNVRTCRAGDATHDCVMQTSRCTFIVGTDNPQQPLATATSCVKPEYSDPCLPEWSEFRRAVLRDRGLDFECEAQK